LIGETLAHYEITALLGKGGMGEVYRASDTKLRREVAIKVLPEVLAGDKDLLARFEREAHLLASLNHPNIAGIHELDHEEGTHFLVMELVEGPGLDVLLAREPMAVDDVMSLFAQLAEALEYAHERGIIHRDLKPANIKLDSDGKAKILDFGLGKAFDHGAVSIGPHDGTVAIGSEPASLQTAEGRILGTPAYMSPEQARGQPMDKRTDIWAFGCCLYEALAGQRPFRGDTATDLLAEIVKSDPEWDSLPAGTPARMRVLLWRCLQKDQKRRLRDIGEARLELSGEGSDPSGILPSLGTEMVPGTVGRRATIIASAVALVCGAIIASVATFSTMRPASISSMEASLGRPVKRFEIDIGRTEPLQMLEVSAEVTISPNGERVAYTVSSGGVRQLYLHELDKNE
jgi:serine/threonine protein kinase